MIREEEVYRIGRLGKTHGVKGELTFQVDDDVFDRVDADCLIIEVEGILVPFFIEEYRWRNDATVLLKLCGIDSQERAQELVNSPVYFPRKLSDSTEDSLTWAEIMGWQLMDAADGQLVGTLSAVDDSTANTLFEVITPQGTTLLAPASNDLIVRVDTQNRQIHMTLPDGLRDL